MTWRTQLGFRVLEGNEAEFYRTAMHLAAEALQSAHMDTNVLDCETGERIFDSASFEQKIVLLYRALAALLKPEVEAPKLTNLTEAAAFFPFAFVQMKVEEEIEDEPYWDEEDSETIIYYYRQLIWNAYEILIVAEHRSLEDEPKEEEEPLLNWRSTDIIDWISALDELADRIFFDRDWQVTSLHPQLLNGLTENFSEQTGIEEYYFVNRLPEVTSQEAETALLALKGGQ